MILTISNIGAQDFTNFGKAKLVKVNGGINANSIFYNGSSQREPFTYFLSGNVNVNIKGVFNIPLNFTYSNQDFETNRPFQFNTLSLHPSYKWVATHIGQVSMSFSPYTLNGHQFSGFGFDLTPDKPYRISAMYGRLQKEVEYEESNIQSIPAYKRLGFGFNAGYKFEKLDLNVILFKASDDENSLEVPIPQEINVTPRENVVASLGAKFTVKSKLDIQLEVAHSTLTENTLLDGSKGDGGPLSFLLNTNGTTQQFKAINANVSYPVASGSVGVGYERIDPEYRTLGAYFFNNDLENITVNASQNILKGKVNVSVNAGLQRDDLDNKKQSQLQRIVSSINIGYTPNEKWSFNSGYSNFRSFTNIKSQFDQINEVTPVDNIDTLDFQQINQNANLNVSYQIKNTKTKTASLNFDFSTQFSSSQQNDKEIATGKSNFQNFSSSYSLGYPKRQLNLTFSANASLNSIGVEEKNITLGPSISANKQFFDRKVSTSANISYNQSRTGSNKDNEVLNFRLNSGYTYKKKHRFSLSFLNQWRSRKESSAANDITATIAYSYAFDNFKVKFTKRDPRKDKTVDQIITEKENLHTNGKQKTDKNSLDKIKKSKGPIIRIVYQEQILEGDRLSLVKQFEALQSKEKYSEIPADKQRDLSNQLQLLLEEKNTKRFKEKTKQYLENLHSYPQFLNNLNALISSAVKDLNNQLEDFDVKFEKKYIDNQLLIKAHSLYDQETSRMKPSTNEELKKEYKKLERREEKLGELLYAHRWMTPKIRELSQLVRVEDNAEIQQLIEREKQKAYRIFENTNDIKAVQAYITKQLIDYYFKKAVAIGNKELRLKYIDKN